MNTNVPSNYNTILAQIKERIAYAQVKTATASNKQMLLLYWQIGNEIIEQQNKQGWGAKVIDSLSKDIRSEFPKVKGFSSRNILYMKQFADIYPPEVVIFFKELWQYILQNPQHVVAKIQSIENKHNIISQHHVAKLHEQDLIQSPIASITWSHHIVLINK